MQLQRRNEFFLYIRGGAGAPGECLRPTAPAGRGEERPSLLLLSAWEKFAFQENHFIFPGRTKKRRGTYRGWCNQKYVKPCTSNYICGLRHPNILTNKVARPGSITNAGVPGQALRLS